jgi:hypothetical protein
VRIVTRTLTLEHVTIRSRKFVLADTRSSFRWLWYTLFGLLAAGPVCRGAETRVIADKTLVAWVAPADLTQRGGSVLTIEKSQGVFDAIVFGELATSKWMAGSNTFARTNKEQENFAVETVDSKTLVQIAIVYRGKQITIYRNGRKYADYTANGAERFGSESIVLLGLRHVDATAQNRFFTGSIDDARIYGVALDAEQIAALRPNQLSDPKPLAWWDFEDGRPADRMKLLPASTLFGDARIANGHLQLDKSGAYLMASKAAPESAQASIDFSNANSSARALRERLLADPFRPGYHFVVPEGPKSVEAGPLELGADEPLRLRVFVDKSVVEVFANGRQAVMRRIYPSCEESVGVTLFSKGGPASVTRLEAWDMMPSNPY